MIRMKKILVANWKMHKTRREALSFLAALQEPERLSLKIAAPYTLIAELVDACHGREVEIGAQNMHEAASGAYTGEISLGMLRDVGAKFVLIGHSERRHLFKESEEEIQAKVERAVVEGFPLILCVGETEEEKTQGETEEVLKRQLLSALEELSVEQLEKVLIAYEPVWAIGTGKNAIPSDVNNTHRSIRDILFQSLGAAPPILYGGSVSVENISDFLRFEHIAGALVGGASLEVSNVNQMIQKIEFLEV